jgi:hypothetical protein
MNDSINICEERKGEHVFWRVTFDYSRSGLYPTREAACQAARFMLDLEEAIAAIREGGE